MNVLMLASTLPRHKGDQQPAFVLEQAQALQQSTRSDVCIIAPHDKGSRTAENLDGVEVRRYRYFFPASAQALAYPAILPNLRKNPLLAVQIPTLLLCQLTAVLKRMRKQPPDMIYAHWIMPQGIIAAVIHAIRKTPYVIHNHSSDLTVFSKLGAPGRMVARHIIRNAECMFCVNRDQKEYALGLFDATERNEIGERIHVLPMGVSPSLSGVDETGANAGDARFDLAMICRLSRKKGVDLFLRAANGLSFADRPVRVGIAGDGELRQSLQDMPFDGDLVFTGFLAGEEKRQFLDSARFMVFSSVADAGDVEGLPVALLEALCLGKIVAVSRDTNIELLPEWQTIREDVFFIEDPRDTAAFRTILNEMLALTPDEIEARSQRLKNTMKRYAWPKLIGEYVAALGWSG
ncbi:glycosyltransferase [Nitratireductor sp. XY-223]|uniref:glycosyltransferase n=1 Tax=Nitratireductor sp. XY-223 TaxID=2561926 RepID=UPI0010A9F048|nr:glycosyltransferase [Nitratireductor sp. XY-223]